MWTLKKKKKPNNGSSFFNFLVLPCGPWDLSFLTRDQTLAPAVEALIFNHWTTREFPCLHFNCPPPQSWFGHACDGRLWGKAAPYEEGGLFS